MKPLQHQQYWDLMERTSRFVMECVPEQEMDSFTLQEKRAWESRRSEAGDIPMTIAARRNA